MSYGVFSDQMQALETNVTIVDVCTELITAKEHALSGEALFSDLNTSINKLGLYTSIHPYIGTKDLALQALIGRDLRTISSEGLGTIVRDALLAIRNFFLNLKANIIALFKSIFDANIKTRNVLLRAMLEFEKRRSLEQNAMLAKLRFSLIPHEQAVQILANLHALFGDCMRMSTSTDIENAAQFTSGITTFGYIVTDGVVYEKEPLVLDLIETSLGENENDSANWGWTLYNFQVVTRELCQICTNASKLNALKNKLENAVNASIRNIDRYIAVGKVEEADLVQSSLNNDSKRSTYVYKCAAVFQSYVTQLVTLFTAIWTNINNVNPRNNK